MEPLNKKEREKALIDFSLIFALTLIIAVALIVLAFNLPGKINKDTKIKLAKYEQNQKDLDKLVVNVDSLVNLLNSQKGTNNTSDAINITSLLENLQKKGVDSTNVNFRIYAKFYSLVTGLKDQIDNNKNLVSDDCTKNLETAKKELDKAKEESEKYKEKYTQLILQMQK